MTDWTDPHFAPPGEIIRLLVTDGAQQWEYPQDCVLDGPSGQFFIHQTEIPLPTGLTIIGWREA